MGKKDILRRSQLLFCPCCQWRLDPRCAAGKNNGSHNPQQLVSDRLWQLLWTGWQQPLKGFPPYQSHTSSVTVSWGDRASVDSVSTYKTPFFCAVIFYSCVFLFSFFCSVIMGQRRFGSSPSCSLTLRPWRRWNQRSDALISRTLPSSIWPVTRWSCITPLCLVRNPCWPFTPALWGLKQEYEIQQHTGPATGCINTWPLPGSFLMSWSL